MRNGLRIAGYALGGTAILALGVAATMWLWNALMPRIAGWQHIGYWQALGLLVLVRLLFGRFGRLSEPRGGHRHLHEMLRGMSRDEKREFIRRRMRSLCEQEETADDTAAH